MGSLIEGEAPGTNAVLLAALHTTSQGCHYENSSGAAAPSYTLNASSRAGAGARRAPPTSRWSHSDLKVSIHGPFSSQALQSEADKKPGGLPTNLKPELHDAISQLPAVSISASYTAAAHTFVPGASMEICAADDTSLTTRRTSSVAVFQKQSPQPLTPSPSLA